MNRDDGVQTRALVQGDQDFVMTIKVSPRVHECGAVACHVITLEEGIAEGIPHFL
jgi:hypothetical protein